MRYHAGSFSQEFDCDRALVFFAPALLPTTETLSLLRNAPTSSLVQTFAGFPPVAGGVCAGAVCDAAGAWDCDWPFAAQGFIASRTANEIIRRFMQVCLFLAGCTPRPGRGVQPKLNIDPAPVKNLIVRFTRSLDGGFGRQIVQLTTYDFD